MNDDKKKGRFAIIQINSRDGNFTAKATVERGVGPVHVFMIKDNETDQLYAADAEADVKWTKYEELDFDLRMTFTEDHWKGMWFAMWEASDIPPPSPAVIEEYMKEMREQGRTRDITLKPVQQQLERNKDKIRGSAQEFVENMDEVWNECMEIYGDERIVEAQMDWFEHLLDEEFHPERKGENTFRSCSNEEFQEKMDRVIAKATSPKHTKLEMVLEEDLK